VLLADFFDPADATRSSRRRSRAWDPSSRSRRRASSGWRPCWPGSRRRPRPR